MEIIKRFHLGCRPHVQVASYSWGGRLRGTRKIRIKRGSARYSLQAVFLRIASDAGKLPDQCKLKR